MMCFQQLTVHYYCYIISCNIVLSLLYYINTYYYYFTLCPPPFPSDSGEPQEGVPVPVQPVAVCGVPVHRECLGYTLPEGRGR